jgi:hypothetical protein
MTLTGIIAERLDPITVPFSLHRVRIHSVFGLTAARNIPRTYFIAIIPHDGHAGRNTLNQILHN